VYKSLKLSKLTERFQKNVHHQRRKLREKASNFSEKSLIKLFNTLNISSQTFEIGLDAYQNLVALVDAF
jgi:hypothetical protein